MEANGDRSCLKGGGTPLPTPLPCTQKHPVTTPWDLCKPLRAALRLTHALPAPSSAKIPPAAPFHSLGLSCPPGSFGFQDGLRVLRTPGLSPFWQSKLSGTQGNIHCSPPGFPFLFPFFGEHSKKGQHLLCSTISGQSPPAAPSHEQPLWCVMISYRNTIYILQKPVA